jgi:hypothetical protein
VLEGETCNALAALARDALRLFGFESGPVACTIGQIGEGIMSSREQKQTQKSRTAVAEIPDNASLGVDRIRDILFGTQIEEYERRFKELKNELHAKSADLGRETGNKLNALEALVKKETASLSKNLKEEGETRDQVAQGLDASLSNLGEAIEGNIKNLSAELKKDIQDLRGELSSQLEGLDSKIQEEQKALRNLMDTHFKELQSSKTDRKALAKYLTEVADKLGRNSKVQGKP